MKAEKQMRYRNFLVFIPGVVFLGLLTSMTAAPVEIAGTLQDVNGFALPGKITVIQEVSHLRFTTHKVGKDGLLRFESDSGGELVLHAATAGHPPAERVSKERAVVVANQELRVSLEMP